MKLKKDLYIDTEKSRRAKCRDNDLDWIYVEVETNNYVKKQTLGDSSPVLQCEFNLNSVPDANLKECR